MKKLLSLLLVLCLTMSLFCGLSFNASAAGNSIATASTIYLNNTYSGSITDSNPKDVYKINLSSSGCLTIKMTAYIYHTRYYLYDAEGVELWVSDWHSTYWNDNTEVFKDTWNLDLTKGTYYFAVSQSDGTGSYNFSTSFASASESFTETQGGNNNSINDADTIYAGNTYNGQIAINDDKDLYKISLSSSGRLTIKMTAYIYHTRYYLYDAEGVELWVSDWYSTYWNDNTEVFKDTWDFDLTKGTYYFAVAQSDGIGNYNFSTSFVSSAESFTETQGGNNNSINDADTIIRGKTYKGQLAINDSKDLYKFTVDRASEIYISLSAYINRTQFLLYNNEGKEIWSIGWYDTCWDEKTKKYSGVHKWDLTKGTYYFAVSESSGTGNYSFTISCDHKYNDVKTYKCSICGTAVTAPTLRNTNGVWYYYKNGVLDISNTLVNYGGNWLHVNGGKWVKDTTLVYYGGKWCYVKNGILDASNTLVKFGDKWLHVNGGKWVQDTTVVNYNGRWLYVKDGILNTGTTFVNYNGSWVYVKNGVMYTANTLVYYGGEWLHVNGGKWVKDTTLVKYGGNWVYVKNGVMNTSNTLVYYKGSWFHVKGGKLALDTTFVNYNGKMCYVKNGVMVTSTTLIPYKGKWIYIKNGIMNTSNTLVNYKGQWFHVKGGQWVKDTTFVNYNGRMCYVKNGIMVTSTTLVPYNGKWIYIKNGIMDTSDTLVNYNGQWLHVKDGQWVRDNTYVYYKGYWFRVRNGVVC